MSKAVGMIETRFKKEDIIKITKHAHGRLLTVHFKPDDFFCSDLLCTTCMSRVRTANDRVKFYRETFTYIYLQCLNHDPIILAETESGQHLYDLPQLRKDILNRVEVVEDFKNYFDADFAFTNRYSRNTAEFLWAHPKCELGIVDEYGVSHSTIAPYEQKDIVVTYGGVPYYDSLTGKNGKCTHVRFKDDISSGEVMYCSNDAGDPWPS